MPENTPRYSATLVRFPKPKVEPGVQVTASERTDEKRAIEEAVYCFMRAQRLLGRDSISLELIALGLQLPHKVVEHALQSLSYRMV